MGETFRVVLSFRDCCQLRRDEEGRNSGGSSTQSSELQHTIERTHFPTYDGSTDCTARNWVEKLDTSFQLDRITEGEAIKMATSLLEDEGTQDCGELLDTPSVTQDSPLLETSLSVLVDILVERVEPTPVEPSIEVMTGVMSEILGDN